MFLAFVGLVLLLIGLTGDVDYAIVGMVLALVGVAVYQLSRVSRRGEASRGMRCLYCGGPLDSERVFCTKCGRSNV